MLLDYSIYWSVGNSVAGLHLSVAERSLPLLNLVEMLYQPRAQLLLCRWGQLQDHLHKAQRLKNGKIATSVDNNMRAWGAQLLKGNRLARLVGTARSRLCVGKHMIQTVAQDHCQYIKDDLALARCTELLELPAATLQLFVVLLNLRALCVVTHDPRRAPAQISGHQDDRIGPLFLLIPEPNHTGVQRHLTLCPHMLNPAHQGNALLGPGGMALPPVCHVGQLYGLLRCEHVRFERHDDIDPTLTLQVG